MQVGKDKSRVPTILCGEADIPAGCRSYTVAILRSPPVGDPSPTGFLNKPNKLTGPLWGTLAESNLSLALRP